MALIVPHGFMPLSRVLRRGEEAFGYAPDDPRQYPEGDLLARLAGGHPRASGLVIGRYDGEPLTAEGPAVGTQVEVPASAWVSYGSDVDFGNGGTEHDTRLRVGDLFVLPLLAVEDGDAWVASMAAPVSPPAGHTPIGFAASLPCAGVPPLPTGMSGRPRTAALVEPEFERRLKSGDYAGVVGAEARLLLKWLRANHPAVPTPRPKSIEPIIRRVLARFKASSNVAQSGQGVA